MSSINSLRGNLKKVDMNNVIRFIADNIFPSIEDIQDHNPGTIYDKGQQVYMMDGATGKHNIYTCKNNGTNGVFNIDHWDISTKVDGSYIEEKLIMKADRAYVDNQIATVTATGIPKLVSYPYIVSATLNGQTVINISDNFDKDTDTVMLYKNTTFVSPDKYTKTSAIESPQTDGFITLVDQTLIDSVVVGTVFVILILKNVPIGPDGAINGVVLSTRSLPQNRIAGFDNLAELPVVGPNETMCIVNNMWYQSNGIVWIPMGGGIDSQSEYVIANNQHQLSQDLNILDISINLETLMTATLTGVSTNIFIETFLDLDDITLINGVFDAENRKVYLS